MTASARIAETFDYMTRIHQGWLTEAEEVDLLERLLSGLPEGHGLRRDSMTGHAYLIISAFPGLTVTSGEIGADLGISKQHARSACLTLVRRGLVQTSAEAPAVYWVGERL